MGSDRCDEGCDVHRGDRHCSDGNVTEPYILGHRDGNYYHKWASIQIVGHDTPLMLDALPTERGMSKDEIVDELLRYATEMVDDIDLVII